MAKCHIRQAEPAWHRSLRKRRTHARFLLSGFLAGAQIQRTRVLKAITVLRQHHTPSLIAQKAALHLEQTAATMTHAWCDICQEHRSNRLQFCGKCGTHLQVYAQPDNQPPWKGWQTHPSPRRRWQEEWTADGRTQSPRRRASPRRKGRDGGASGQKGGKGLPSASDRGRGKGSQSDRRTAPTVQDLPKPPELEVIPKPGPTVKAEIVDEKPSSSSTLLSQLVASREALPPEIQALLDKEVEQDAKASTKQLHRLVSQQGSARRELQSLHKMRDSFLLEWSSYISQLCTLVEQQMQSKAETLMELDQAEEAWRTQMAQATNQIALASGVAPPTVVESGEPIDLETDQEEAEQEVARAAAVASKKRRMLAELEQQEKSISAALAQAKTAADESAQALRERTPRRGAKTDGKDFP